ncbi:MAG: hypothetical protein Crog4KO_23970 [Crocinitomicaceae bacterium]
MPIVNGFRALMLPYREAPPLLREIGTIEEMTIYHSDFNELIYVVFNPEDELYYAFENVEVSKEPLKDITFAIEAFIKKN